AVGKGCNLFDWIDNQWADFFAGLGRDEVALSDTFARDCKFKFASAVDVIAMLGQLAQRHVEWAQKLVKSEVPKVATAKVPVAAIEYHDVWHDPAPGASRCWQCRKCNAMARTDHALRNLRTKERFKCCVPTAVMSWTADCFFRDNPQYVPVNEPPNEEELAAKPSEPGALRHFRGPGHAPCVFGPITICKRCARYCISGGRVLGLNAQCHGPSDVPSARAGQKAAIKR
ncbi:unnamed protein product, partial [Prorocentrum cordatum]